MLRQPIYEKDRMDPVDPAARLELDPALLARFPEGYRHLAYLQTGIGYTVKPDMPGLKGPEVEALYARGRAWLEGGAAIGLRADCARGDRDLEALVRDLLFERRRTGDEIWRSGGGKLAHVPPVRRFPVHVSNLSYLNARTSLARSQPRAHREGCRSADTARPVR